MNSVLKLKTGQVLKRLMFDHDLRVMDIARITGIPQPTLQRIVTGATPNPHHSTLRILANYFKITIEQLKGIEPASMPPHKTHIQSHHGITDVPLIPWPFAHTWQKSTNQTMHEHEFIVTQSNAGKSPFALKLKDSSMSPIFSKDTVIIIAPDREIIDRCYVIVKLMNYPEVIFRQIVIDARQQYLKAHNPDLLQFKMIQLTQQDQICGVLVEARRVFDKT